MRTALVIVLAFALVAPLAGADPVPNKGIPNACESSPPGEPCKFLKPPTRVITESRVIAGQNRTYTGDWFQNGTLTIDGSVRFESARVLETNTSGGIVVNPGGTLVINTSSLSDDGGSPFKIVAHSGSTVQIVDSAVLGGQGVAISTAAPQIHRTTFQGIPTALTLTDVSATLTGNLFVGNALAVYQTGGQPRLVGNTFENNYECVHDYRTDPDIIGNVFAHCIIGIWHEESHSTIRDNVMYEDFEPPSAGMIILNGNSPLIENNTIRNFQHGIIVQNARAYVRNNTITDNAQEGILVVQNSMPMDVQGNVVRGNGGHGIRLTDAVDVVVANNTVDANGGDGIRIDGASSLVKLLRNRATANGGAGFAILGVNGVSLQNDTSLDNTGVGFSFVDASSATGTGLLALRNAHGLTLLRSFGDFRGSNASENRGSGFLVDSGSILVGSNLSCVRALRNVEYGVLNFGGLDSATLGWYQGNTRAGMKTDDVDSFVDARDSYWGSTNGPSPTGSGDKVEGQVLFVPYASSPPSCPAR